MESPSQNELITKDNLGPAVNIATWSFLVCGGIFLGFRITNKIRKRHELMYMAKFGIDDVTVGVAAITAVVQSILVSQQVHAGGLGLRWSALTPQQMEAYQKLSYAAEFFYLISLASARLSALSFYYTLSRARAQIFAVYISLAFTAAWTVAMMFTIAFQCAPSGPLWAIITAKCIDQRTFWTTFETFNILQEVALVLQAKYLLSGLQMPWRNKLTVFSVFAFRALIIPLLALRLLYSRKVYVSEDKSTQESYVAIITSACIYFSLMATCMPLLRPLMAQLQVGWGASDVRHGVGYNTIVGSKRVSAFTAPSSGLRYLSKSGKGSTLRSPPPSVQKSPIHGHFAWELTAHPHYAVTKIERDSSRPQTSESNRMIIKQTRTYGVESESST